MESERLNPYPYFLPELLTEVLLHLPVKSLVRFVSVSKTWHSLIKDSSFIRQKINLSHENAADKQRLLVRRFRLYEAEPTLSMHEDNENFCQNDLPKLPKRFVSLTLTYICSYVCDGEILCVLLHNGFILWNPSINKTIWVPEHIKHMFWSMCHYGFGFDAKTKDYKVLRIDYTSTSSRLKRARVFSLREGYWRDIIAEPPQHSFGSKSINLNGFIYWIILPGKGGGMNWILAFDLGAEEFVKIADLPDILAYQRKCNLELVVFEKLISLFHTDYYVYNCICSLWVMKEKDVWTKMWSYGPAMNFTPLGLRLNGELLLMETNVESQIQELRSLNPKTHNRRSLGIQGLHCQVDKYVESLALFDYD